MRIAVNLRDQSFQHSQSLGILHASLGLTRALASHPQVEQLIVATNRELGACAGPERAGLSYCGLHTPVPRGLQRVLWDQWDVSKLGAGAEIDWLLLPKGFPPWLHSSIRARRVCSYVHDDMVLTQPYRERSTRTRLQQLYFGSLLRAALAHSDLVVTNSHYTRERLRQLTDDAPLVTVGLGFDPPPLLQRTRKHIVLLTSAHAHKLTERAIRWLTCWHDTTRSTHPVVGIGGLPRHVTWPERPYWRRVQRPAADEYEALLQDASVLIYFSGYEGYGLPPREALQRGVWTLASDLPALREDMMLECLFDNEHYEDFARKLTKSLNAALSGAAPPTIVLPTWSEVASRLLTAMVSRR
jgi:glycosyltransferase involved in cell wall biosynthesis